MQLIGSGTYGKVYRARDNWNNKIIAVKRIHCGMTQPGKRKFLDREQEHLTEMEGCINIVQLLNTYEKQIALNELQIDLIFEYCQFDLLKVIHNKRISFRLPEIKCIMQQILNGLNCMHDKMVGYLLIFQYSSSNLCRNIFFISYFWFPSSDNASRHKNGKYSFDT